MPAWKNPEEPQTKNYIFGISQVVTRTFWRPVFIPEYFFGRNNNNLRQNTNILIKLVKLLYFLNTADSSGTNLWVN